MRLRARFFTLLVVAALVSSLAADCVRAASVEDIDAAGDLDASFGQNGRVMTGTVIDAEDGYTVVIQPDGKIVVGSSTISSPSDISLVRYNPDGSLDGTFGNAGKVEDRRRINDLTLDAEQRILAAVGAGSEATMLDFGIARYLPGGRLDPSFGNNGLVRTDFWGGNDRALGIAVQSDGKIVVGGYAGDSSFAAARYHQDGSLDAAFGTGGKVYRSLQEAWPTSMVLQPDGKIVLGGYSYWSFALFRYTASGAPDPSFGSDPHVPGFVRAPIGSRSAVLTSLALQQDNKIVAAGFSWTNFNTDYAFTLARFDTDGSLDSLRG